MEALRTINDGRVFLGRRTIDRYNVVQSDDGVAFVPDNNGVFKKSAGYAYLKPFEGVYKFNTKDDKYVCRFLSVDGGYLKVMGEKESERKIYPFDDRILKAGDIPHYDCFERSYKGIPELSNDKPIVAYCYRTDDFVGIVYREELNQAIPSYDQMDFMFGKNLKYLGKPVFCFRVTPDTPNARKILGIKETYTYEVKNGDILVTVKDAGKVFTKFSFTSPEIEETKKIEEADAEVAISAFVTAVDGVGEKMSMVLEKDRIHYDVLVKRLEACEKELVSVKNENLALRKSLMSIVKNIAAAVSVDANLPDLPEDDEPEIYIPDFTEL